MHQPNIINWDLFATLAGFWEDSAMDNIDEEYDWLVEHLHDCTKKAERFKTTKRHLKAIKEDLKEGRAEVLAEAAEARRSIRYARRDFASRKTRMTALRNPEGTTIASRREMEEIMYDFFFDLCGRSARPIEKVLDEGQQCEQAGFRKGFSRINHIHTVSKLIEVSREYKMPLCLTFIDLKKAFDSVETEAVEEALDNQGVPTQFIKGDTISPKIFTATLENAMRKLKWDDMGVKVDGRQLHHLRFADEIVLITPNISQAERMLTDFDEICGCIGLQKKTFMRNGWVSDALFTINGTNISESTSYVYLGRKLNMKSDLTPELDRRRRAVWGAYKSIEDVVKKTRNTQLQAHLFNTTVLPALTYASGSWAFCKQEENAVSVIERAIERVMLGVSRFTQVRDGIRSYLLCHRSRLETPSRLPRKVE
ncbi:hypothetical protein RB195_015677 [Necator americanus]|uniref:Reverse transcriptase domain-containing protein n=1 Tax=Necator americanus TaxID=51031 RepID=A0ABR1E7K0_NECAM